ncbi:MAG: sulfatase [Prolixibacteraceae bacterium]
MNKLITNIGLAISTLGASNSCIHPEARPNILWIVADDLGPDLGCFGNKNVATPYIDRLASEGIIFTHTYTVTPVCSPSRSALITGMNPVSVNCHQHRTRNRNLLPDGILPITEYFRQAGYYVCNGDGTRDNKPGKTDYNFEFSGSLYDGADWSDRKDGQPFFAQLQIHFPHRPFKADPEHPVNRSSVRVPPVYPDHPLVREDWSEYLESVQYVDKYVGKIIDRLRKENLLNNTIIFFFGDQGRPMVRAKQFLYDSGIHTPLIIRFPDEKRAGTAINELVSVIDIPATSLVLAQIPLPEKIQGKNIFSDNKREYVFSSRDRMDETVDRIRAVRSVRFKYIRNYYPTRPYTQSNTYKKTMYPVLTLMKVLYKKGELSPEQAAFMGPNRPEEELYDLEADPDEIHNLVGNPNYSSILKKLSLALNKWVAENDRGTYPEDTTETGYWVRDADSAYRQKMNSYHLPENISDEDFLNWWEKRLNIRKK